MNKKLISTERKNNQCHIIAILDTRYVEIIECVNSLINNTDGTCYKISFVLTYNDSAVSTFIKNISKKNPHINIIFGVDKNPKDIITYQLEKTECEFLAIVFSDAIVPQNWLPRLLMPLIKHDLLAVISPLNNTLADYAAPMGPGINFLSLDNYLSQKNDCHLLPRLSNNSVSILRISILKKISGFLFESTNYREHIEQLVDCLCLKEHIAVTSSKVYIYQRKLEESTARFLPKTKMFGHKKFNRSDANSLLTRNEQQYRKAPFTAAREIYRRSRFHFRNKEYKTALISLLRGLPALFHYKELVFSQAAINKFDRPKTLKITYVLHNLTVAGGVISVVQLVNELILLGVEVRLVALYQYQETKDWKLYTTPIIYRNVADLITNFPESDIAVATHWTTAGWVDAVKKSNKAKSTAYFIQDYESWFFSENETESRNKVLNTYALISNKIVKSNWLHHLIKKDGYDSKIIPLGLDLGIFYKRELSNKSTQSTGLTVVAMARPGTPRRGFDTLQKALTLIQEEYPATNIVLFGDDLSQFNLNFSYEDAGIISDYNSIAELHSRADIFIDSSNFQGFGRTSLEAMACACCCILTGVGGVTEYAKNETNCLIVPPKDPIAIFAAFQRIQKSPNIRVKLSQNALITAAGYSHKREAYETLLFFKEILEKKEQ